MRFEKEGTQDRGPQSQALQTMVRSLNFIGKKRGKSFKPDSDAIRLVFRMIIWLPCTKCTREGRVGRQSVNRRKVHTSPKGADKELPQQELRESSGDPHTLRLKGKERTPELSSHTPCPPIAYIMPPTVCH